MRLLVNYSLVSSEIMPNPNALYEDMEKLNALYEELCWGHDDELVFTHNGSQVIIINKTKNPHTTYKI